VGSYVVSQIEGVNEASLREIADLWSAAVPRFLLRMDVLRACLATGDRWVCVVQARSAHDLAGFGYATQRSDDVPRLQAIVVAPGHRRRGIGRSIAEALLQACRGRRATSVEVGAGSGYLWPGVPDDLPDASAFITALGFRSGLPTYDLRGDTTNIAPLPRPPGDRSTSLAFGAASPGDVPEVFRFVEAEFERDWALDLREFLEAGGRPGDIYLARDGGALQGFTRLHFPSSSPVGPPLYWTDPGRSSIGGLGPIGVSSARRGQGVGTALLRAALVHLRANGCTDIVIDMTHLLTFYGQFGFSPWLRFHQAALDLSR
jgi:GNAT superfamily N-acetyltransferase